MGTAFGIGSVFPAGIVVAGVEIISSILVGASEVANTCVHRVVSFTDVEEGAAAVECQWTPNRLRQT